MHINDRIRIFDKQAVKYENKRESENVTRWRSKIIKQASGHVLELAVGAGANFPHYAPGIKVTAVDFSSAMIEKAAIAAERFHMDVHLIVADIEEIHFEEKSFDSIVSTLSLCSYENPHQVLVKLIKWLKPDGRILLFEHGISSNRLVAAIQKLLNPLLYRTYGCHQTRDMLQIIREAGLKTIKVDSYMFQSIHLITAKPI